MIDIHTFNPFDWLLIAILLSSTIMAFMTGFFRELFSLAGLIAGVLLASWNYPLVGPRLAAFMPWATAQIVAFLSIAILVMVLCGIAGKLVSKTVKTIGLGFVDRLLGAVFGFARGCLLGVAVMMAAAAFLPHEGFIRSSRLSGYFLDGAHAVSFLVPNNLQQHIRQGANELKHSSHEWVKRSR